MNYNNPGIDFLLCFTESSFCYIKHHMILTKIIPDHELHLGLFLIQLNNLFNFVLCTVWKVKYHVN